MPFCPKCASEFQPGVQPPAASHVPPPPPSRRSQESGETTLETALTSAVIGLTAQFIVFLFGVVMQVTPSMAGNMALSTAAGLGVGAIAFALLNDDDPAGSRR